MNAATLLEHLPVGTDSIIGHARLNFELPEGRLSGRGELSVPVRGRPCLKVRVEQFSAEPPYDSSPIPFLTGAEPIKAGGVVSFSLGARECRFASLLLETDAGTFSATASIVEPNEIYPAVQSVTATILALVFTPREAREPRFWLATLHCSCSDFAMNRPANHVLAFPDRMLYPFQGDRGYCAFQPLAYEADSSNVSFDAIIFGDLDTCRALSTAIEACLVTMLATGRMHREPQSDGSESRAAIRNRHRRHPLRRLGPFPGWLHADRQAALKRHNLPTVGAVEHHIYSAPISIRVRLARGNMKLRRESCNGTADETGTTCLG